MQHPSQTHIRVTNLLRVRLTPHPFWLMSNPIVAGVTLVTHAFYKLYNKL